MKLLDKIGGIFDGLKGKISRDIAEQLADKTTVVVRSGLVEIDRLAPIVTDLIAGRKVTVHTKTEVWLEENEADTK